jgi:hypothetical protein
MNTNTPSRHAMYQAMPANSSFAMTTTSQLAPLEDLDDQNVDGTKKSIDERVFSDFSIDGSAKDFKQIKLEEVKLAAYEEEKKQKDDDFEGMLREQAVAEMEMMRFSNGLEISLEDYQEITDELIEDIENDPDAYAAENGLSVVEATMMLEMLKESRKNGFDEEEMRKKYGDKIVDTHIGDVEEKIEQNVKFDVARVEQAELNESAIDANNDLSQEEMNVEVAVKNDTMDEWDSLETGSSISVAEQVASYSENNDSSVKLKSEYNLASQGEAMSIINTAKFDNSAAYQISDNDISVAKPIEISIG